MTAMFNFAPDPQPVVSIAEKPSLQIGHIGRDEVDQPIPAKRETKQSPMPTSGTISQHHACSSEALIVDPESATESEGDKPMQDQRKTSQPDSTRPSTEQRERLAPMASLKSPLVSQAKAPSSDSGSSSQRPTKKAKPGVPSSSDDGSGDDRRKKGGSTVVKKGTRQPIKRGGKRF